MSTTAKNGVALPTPERRDRMWRPGELAAAQCWRGGHLEMSNVTEANFSKLTPPSAHPALQAASDYGRACFRMAAAKLGTAEYDAALAECNETWERIAAASGVALGRAPEPKMPRWPAYVCRDECQEAKAGREHCDGTCRVAHGVQPSQAPSEKEIANAFADEQMRPGSGTHSRHQWFKCGVLWALARGVALPRADQQENGK